ncbi:MAG: guanylate kinase [Faecalibacterium sp.]
MENEKYLFVVSGPSGVGKDTVVSALREQHPEIGKTISATTRAPRPGEQEGVNYFYRTREEFEALVQQGQIVEYNFYSGNYYGTLRSEVDRHLEAGTFVVLVIDVHGADNIKRQYPGCTTVFLLPPSAEELEQRLRSRGTEDEASVQRRLEESRAELARAPEFDLRLVNHEVASCAGELYQLMARRAAD